MAESHTVRCLRMWGQALCVSVCVCVCVCAEGRIDGVCVHACMIPILVCSVRDLNGL